ncbi:hypothetical protein M8J76_003448 [Diaphorina citri]|nr:hypothetical protein M8J76_003448 [Diaphorina citri]
MKLKSQLDADAVEMIIIPACAQGMLIIKIMSEQNLPREERTADLVNALTNNQYREIVQIKERLMKLDSDECLDGGQNLNSNDKCVGPEE